MIKPFCFFLLVLLGAIIYSDQASLSDTVDVRGMEEECKDILVLLGASIDFSKAQCSFEDQKAKTIEEEIRKLVTINNTTKKQKEERLAKINEQLKGIANRIGHLGGTVEDKGILSKMNEKIRLEREDLEKVKKLREEHRIVKRRQEAEETAGLLEDALEQLKTSEADFYCVNMYVDCIDAQENCKGKENCQAMNHCIKKPLLTRCIGRAEKMFYKSYIEFTDYYGSFNMAEGSGKDFEQSLNAFKTQIDLLKTSFNPKEQPQKAILDEAIKAYGNYDKEGKAFVERLKDQREIAKFKPIEAALIRSIEKLIKFKQIEQGSLKSVDFSSARLEYYQARGALSKGYNVVKILIEEFKTVAKDSNAEMAREDEETEKVATLGDPKVANDALVAQNGYKQYDQIIAWIDLLNDNLSKDFQQSLDSLFQKLGGFAMQVLRMQSKIKDFISGKLKKKASLKDPATPQKVPLSIFLSTIESLAKACTEGPSDPTGSRQPFCDPTKSKQLSCDPTKSKQLSSDPTKSKQLSCDPTMLDNLLRQLTLIQESVIISQKEKHQRLNIAAFLGHLLSLSVNTFTKEATNRYLTLIIKAINV